MAIYDLDTKLSIENAKDKIERLAYAKKKVEIKEYKQTRSGLQNSALHLFFAQLAEQLNEIGQEYHFTGYDGLPREFQQPGWGSRHRPCRSISRTAVGPSPPAPPPGPATW